MDKISLKKLLGRLATRRGDRSFRVWCTEVGVSHAYLAEVSSGKKLPGPKILIYLGVTRNKTAAVTYREGK